MGSVFSAPSRISHAASCISQATQVFIHLMSEDTNLRGHHPASLGGTINSARMTLDSIRTTVDAINIPQISFFLRIAGAVAGYAAIQGDLTHKRIATSLEGLAKDLSRHAEIKNVSYLTGNQGFPVQILNFANEVAAKRNSRFILAYYPSNLPDPDINTRLSDPNAPWRHLDRQTCFFQVFHDWSCLVAHIILIHRTAEYKKSEPICILFPANCSSILNNILCDIPTTGGLDPDAVSFHGQLDMDGTPLTWLPAELTIAGTPIYTSTNVFGLGFISTEKIPPQFLQIFTWALLALYMLCMVCMTLAIPPGIGVALSCFLVYFSILLTGVAKEKEVVLRRKRPCDGVGLLVDRCKIFKVESVNRPFALERDLSKRLTRVKVTCTVPIDLLCTSSLVGLN